MLLAVFGYVVQRGDDWILADQGGSKGLSVFVCELPVYHPPSARELGE